MAPVSLLLHSFSEHGCFQENSDLKTHMYVRVTTRPEPSGRVFFVCVSITNRQRRQTFLKNTVFFIVIMCLMYNLLQNTQNVLLFTFCYKFKNVSPVPFYHYLHFEKFSERLNKLVSDPSSDTEGEANTCAECVCLLDVYLLW